MTDTGRFAIIIPVYNHEQRVADVVRGALKLGFPVFVVDDGSTDATYERVKDMAGVSIIRHEKNRGKGAAIKTGFASAAATADWAITIDADGQHNPEDALGLIRAIPSAAGAMLRRPIIIGMRENMTGNDVPWTSSFGRGFSNFWVRASGGPVVSDSQSGFRIYPLPECTRLTVRANRFQFEVEILAKAGWLGFPVIEAPVSVSYTPGTPRISHFRPFVDFWRNSGTFMRLIFQRILIPRFIRSKMAYKDI
ncbi:MAG: glycosyltransferase family 2 protein [Spirochaetes bacterium]|nr:glycosyltransferase family 2 protein [Spirochaetota bacterium]